MGNIPAKEIKASEKVRKGCDPTAQENKENISEADTPLPAIDDDILPGFVVVSSAGKAPRKGGFAQLNVPSAATATIPNESPLSSLSDQRGCPSPPAVDVEPWDRRELFSDFVYDDLRALDGDGSNVVMLFECPTSCASGTSFFNR